MAQLRHGAREALDHLESELLYIKDMAYNPEAVEALVDKCLAIMREKIEPRLQRAEPTIQQQINEMSAQHQQDMDELRNQIALLASQKIVFVKE